MCVARQQGDPDEEGLDAREKDPGRYLTTNYETTNVRGSITVQLTAPVYLIWIQVLCLC